VNILNAMGVHCIRAMACSSDKTLPACLILFIQGDPFEFYFISNFRLFFKYFFHIVSCHLNTTFLQFLNFIVLFLIFHFINDYHMHF